MSEVYLNCHVEEKRSFDVNISAIFFILLFPFSSHATCTPTPDCTSIGYTQTSCEGDSLKCPFDISKLYCIPCDTSFKYDCNGENITGGIGSTCGGKYVSCECSGGGVFKDGTCPQQSNCTVGMIYYSDKSCSADYDSAKTAIGIVVKDDELVISQQSSSQMYWANSYIDTSLTDMTREQAKADYNGKSNTAVIVSAYPSDTSSNNAAIYCNSYSTTGTNAGDWYLPATGELYSYVHGNYNAISASVAKLGWILNAGYFWSSTEVDKYNAWAVDYENGYVSYPSSKDEGKTYYYPVTCFLSIN